MPPGAPPSSTGCCRGSAVRTQFGTTCVERPATAQVLRQEVRAALGRDEPWTWVAEVDGQLTGLLMIDPPERAGWVAPLDAAGAAVTLLHYAGLNPLSGPFWHRCGYRPLWTTWRVSPAARLGR